MVHGKNYRIFRKILLYILDGFQQFRRKKIRRKKKKYRTSATHEDMDRVDALTKAIMSKYLLDRQRASKLALQLFLIKNPDKYKLQSGGKYKKHKTLKRKHSSKKHRKFTNKRKKHKRTRYHRNK